MKLIYNTKPARFVVFNLSCKRTWAVLVFPSDIGPRRTTKFPKGGPLSQCLYSALVERGGPPRWEVIRIAIFWLYGSLESRGVGCDFPASWIRGTLIRVSVGVWFSLLVQLLTSQVLYCPSHLLMTMTEKLPAPGFELGTDTPQIQI